MRRSSVPSVLAANAAARAQAAAAAGGDAGGTGEAAAPKPAFRAPVRIAPAVEAPVEAAPGGPKGRYFSCMHTKRSTKKHKTYDDGVLSFSGTHATLFDMEGKQLAKTLSKHTDYQSGAQFDIGTFECEITNEVSAAEFTSGRIFVAAGVTSIVSISRAPAAVSVAAAPARQVLAAFKPVTPLAAVAAAAAASAGGSEASSWSAGAATTAAPDAARPAVGLRPAAASVVNSGAAHSAARTGAAATIGVAIKRAVGCLPSNATAGTAAASMDAAAFGSGILKAGSAPKAYHSTVAPDSLVLQYPPSTSAAAAGSGSSGSIVVVDPVVGRHLKPHQRDGVAFMWQCITGMRHQAAPASDDSGDDDGASAGGAASMADATGRVPVSAQPPPAVGCARPEYVAALSEGPFQSAYNGCILADEMGLGKTIQAIALIHTALKQSVAGRPLAQKAIVVCPSLLVANWQREFKQWVGSGKQAIIDKKGKEAEKQVEDFLVSSPAVKSVMVIGYEMFLLHAKKITEAGNAPTGWGRIDLLVCDEAHRLKSSKDTNKTVTALRSLRANKRILLTGTPVQNNLGELFAMVDFCCPGLLGQQKTFQRVFATAIERGNEKGASAETRRIGQERNAELQRLLAPFLLHRTSAVVEKFLPQKTEATVFCRLTPLQAKLYAAACSSFNSLCGSSDGSGSSGGDGVPHLTAIHMLRNICAHPDLVHPSKPFATAAAKASSSTGGATTVGGSKRPRSAVPSLAVVPVSIGIAKRPTTAALAGTAASGGAGTRSSSAGDDDELFAAEVSDDDEGVEEEELEGVIIGARPPAKRPAVGAAARRAPSSESDDSDNDDEDDADDASSADGEDDVIDLMHGTTMAAGRSAGDGNGSLASQFPGDWAPGLLLKGASGGASAAALSGYIAASSKLAFVQSLLQDIHARNKAATTAAGSASSSSAFPALGTAGGGSVDIERVVIISNFTRTLDLIQGVCALHGFPMLRIDGSTPKDKRDAALAAFNAPCSSHMVFLLTAATGGAGVNLVAANHLVMFDAAWNPAIDAQAMARCWRFGQKRHSFVYRLVSAHTIEEKILQRQLKKGEYQAAIAGSKAGAAAAAASSSGAGGASGSGNRPAFTAAELREIWSMNPLAPGSDTLNIMRRSSGMASTTSRSSSAGSSAAAAADGADAGVDSIADPPASEPSSWLAYGGAAALSDPAVASTVQSAERKGLVVPYVHVRRVNMPAPPASRAASAADEE